jgi:hypothetical protein
MLVPFFCHFYLLRIWLILSQQKAYIGGDACAELIGYQYVIFIVYKIKKRIHEIFYSIYGTFWLAY